MGMSGLGPKWIRRLSRLTGEDVIHGSAQGYHVEFTTAGHRHGWFDMKAWKYPGTGQVWGLYGEDHRCQFVSCRVLFGDQSAGKEGMP